MSNVKLVASLQYIQNAIDNVKLTDVKDAKKDAIVALLNMTKEEIRSILDND